jgi:hypothetical protein
MRVEFGHQPNRAKEKQVNVHPDYTAASIALVAMCAIAIVMVGVAVVAVILTKKGN